MSQSIPLTLRRPGAENKTSGVAMETVTKPVVPALAPQEQSHRF